MIQSQENAQADRRTEGKKNEQTLFYRALLATARGPTSTIAVDWHLKVKDIECDVSLTKI